MTKFNSNDGIDREKTKDVYSNSSETNNDDCPSQNNNKEFRSNQRRQSSSSTFTFSPFELNSNQNDSNTSSTYTFSHEIICDNSLSFSSSIMGLMSNQQISEAVINSTPIIELSEKEGDGLKGQSIVIKANGWGDSLRKANDGFTFFGPKSTNVSVN